MSDVASLLRQVLNHPDDDTSRLVLADYLRESDDVADQARGRFLWAGVTAARFRQADLIDDPLYYSAHQEIEAVAIAGHPVRWLAAWGIVANTDSQWAWDCTYDRVTLRIGLSIATFTRGLLSGLEITLGQWDAVAQNVLQSNPLEWVAIRDVPGLRFRIREHHGQWLLTALIKVVPRRINFLEGSIPTCYSPSPVLVETDADWQGEESFDTRENLVDAIQASCFSLVQDLREMLGNRWPRGRSDSRK